MNKGSDIQLVKELNIRKVFTEKNAGLAKVIPGFVFRYLEKVVHQKDLNEFLATHGDKVGVDFAKAAIKDFNVFLQVKGEENIPREGRYIFASNHPWGGFDGVLLMEVMSRYYTDFKLLVNDILMNITNLHPLFIPINKHGRQASEAVSLIEETYKSDTQVITFPSGYVSRYIKGQVMDYEWKKSFITKAVRYQRDVVPVYFDGKNSNFFYRLYRIRKFLGIKANLEMFYLVDETYKHCNKGTTVIFGKPIPYTTFDKSKTSKQWAKWVKEQVYALGGITEVPI